MVKESWLGWSMHRKDQTMTYLPRLADKLLKQLLVEHPAVMVVGPRATGKTTMASRFASNAVHLARDREREAFAADIEVGLAVSKPMLIDEWQEVPAVLGHLKTIVDRDPRPGQFIVTGSVRGDSDQQTWPLTGRVVRLPMYGLMEREIEQTNDSWLHGLFQGDVRETRSDVRLDEYVRRALRSGFPQPALALSGLAGRRWLTAYVDQVITRDAAELDGGRDLTRLRRYLTAYALNSAGTADATTIYGAAGISKNSARAYDRLLQNLLLIDEIPAWTSNRLRRMTLAPKRYLVDPGLFVGVLGVTESEVLLDSDLLGRVLETFVVAQIRAESSLMDTVPRLHHLRTHEGRQEIDLVIEVGARRLIAIEIKATATPNSDDAKHLRWLKRELGINVTAVLLHTGPVTLTFDEGVMACPISSLWT
jgi:uncharacterized protein